MLESGANASTRHQHGPTSMLLEDAGTRPDALWRLRTAGQATKLKAKLGQTPPSLAAVRGHEPVARLLLGSGVDIDSKDSDGQTPLLLAAASGHDGVVRLLLQRGADVGLKDNDGQTPLLAATSKAQEAVVATLLAAGAKMGTKE